MDAQRTPLYRPLELAVKVTIEDEKSDEPYPADQIGGEPEWMPNDETPPGWLLLLQLSDYAAIRWSKAFTRLHTRPRALAMLARGFREL